VRTQAPLDWLNFFLADVQAGVGPFLAIFLLSNQHWDAGKIGVVMMIAGVATVAARAPFGALIDWSWRPVPETAPFPARHRSPARQSSRCRLSLCRGAPSWTRPG
jgi:hypothetical protein